jgi:hypothetical protein
MPICAPGKLCILKKELQSKLSTVSDSHAEANIKYAALLILEWVVDQGGILEVQMDRFCGEGRLSPKKFIARLKALGADAFLTRQHMIEMLECFKESELFLAMEAYESEQCIEHLRHLFTRLRLSEYLREVLLHVVSVAHGWSPRPGWYPGVSQWTGWGGRDANRHFQQGARLETKKGSRQRDGLKLQHSRKMDAPGRDVVCDVYIT